MAIDSIEHTFPQCIVEPGQFHLIDTESCRVMQEILKRRSLQSIRINLLLRFSLILWFGWQTHTYENTHDEQKEQVISLAGFYSFECWSRWFEIWLITNILLWQRPHDDFTCRLDLHNDNTTIGQTPLALWLRIGFIFENAEKLMAFPFRDLLISTV